MEKQNKKVKTDFVIYNKILDYAKYTRTYIIVNIPKIHTDIRIHLSDENFNLSKLLFLAIYNKGNIRMKYLIEIQSTISLLDMLLSQIDDLKILKHDYIITSIKKLEEIKNMIYAWIFNEEKAHK